LRKSLKGKTVYIVGADPVNDDPKLAKALEGAKFVAVQDVMETATTEIADVVLPAQAFTEREGTLTSGERRVQRFYPAVPVTGERSPISPSPRRSRATWESSSKAPHLGGVRDPGGLGQILRRVELRQTRRSPAAVADRRARRYVLRRHDLREHAGHGCTPLSARRRAGKS
jgi:NADH dehydrogenase/NADH:ubiquinone oxidoreductase subunit G